MEINKSFLNLSHREVPLGTTFEFKVKKLAESNISSYIMI